MFNGMNSQQSNVPVAILGAGIAGVAAAREIARHDAKAVKLFERCDHAGGIASSFVVDHWTFDYGLHCFFTKYPEVHALLDATVIGGHDRVVPREACFFEGYWRGYPPHLNLHGYPLDLIENCLHDLMEAHIKRTSEPAANYTEWCYRHYGRTLSDTFLLPFVRKYWTVEPDELPEHGLGRRSCPPSPWDILRGALRRNDTNQSEEAFWYPSTRGFQSYVDGLASDIPIAFNKTVTVVDPRQRLVRFADGTSTRYEHLISTIPLPTLVPMIVAVPDAIREAAQQLRCTSLALVSLAINRASVLDHHWVYSYDPSIVWTRLTSPSAYGRGNAPPNTSSLQAEVYYQGTPPDPEQLCQQTVDSLRQLGVLRADDVIIVSDARAATYANVIHDHQKEQLVSTIHAYLLEQGIVVCGRYGNWDSSKFDQVIVEAQRVAREVVERLNTVRSREVGAI